MFDLPLAYAFSAGLVAAFNPCGAAMFPAYVGYQLDASTVNSNPLIAALRGVMLGLAATAGFIAVFGAVGLALAAGGRVVGDFLPFAGLGVGIAIAALGAWLLVSKRKLGLLAAGRVNLGGGRGLPQVFLFGIAYAVASLSCALPIFLAAVGIIAGQQSLSADGARDTVIGSVAYGVGMGAIMIAATLGIVFFKSAVTRWMRKIFPLIEPIGNLAMLGAGAYLIYYWTLGTGGELLTYRFEALFG